MDAETLGQNRLVAELDIRCDDPAATAARLGLAVPVLVVFSLGLPVGAALALWARQSRLRTDPTVRRAWGFLYEGFRVDAVASGWESVIMLRKLLLAVVTVILAPSGPVVQAAVALLVVVAALGLHSWIKPYESRRLNGLEAGGLVAAVITLVAALLLDAGEAGGPTAVIAGRDSRVALTALILGSNLCFFLAALWLSGSHFQQVWSERRRRAAALSARRAPPTSRRFSTTKPGLMSVSGAAESLPTTKGPTLARSSFVHNPLAVSSQAGQAGLLKAGPATQPKAARTKARMQVQT